MNSHTECEVNIDKLGRITFEKSPSYYIDITFSNVPNERFYTVNVKVLKPCGELNPEERSFKFPFSEAGRSLATKKYLEQRSLIDRALSRF